MDERVVFMGSPEFALPTLKWLVENMNVVGVFTQLDRPAGRGKAVFPPPVKSTALLYNLPVIQLESLKTTDAIELLQVLAPDLIVLVAYGKILPREFIDLPRFGCINVHASLLPRWRGASPIQAAIANGDLETGVTIMKMGVGLDDGPILSQKVVPLQSNETAGDLTSSLAKEGALLLSSLMADYLIGKITPIPQDESKVTYAPRIKKADGLLIFSKSAVELERQVRAFNPWPGAYFRFQGQTIRIFASYSAPSVLLAPGEVGVFDRKPVIGTSSGGLVLLELQMPGKRRVQGSDFLRGARNWCGMVDFD